MTTDATTETLNEARRLGAEAGTAAASWVFDGNDNLDHYRDVLKNIEDGDPAIDDRVLEPHWLGGIWAGDPTPNSLATDLGIDWVTNPWLMDQASTAFEDAASEKFWHEVEAFARRMVEDRT